MTKAELLALNTSPISDAVLLSSLVEILRTADAAQGGFGYHIIVGNVARVAPAGFCYGSFTTRTDGVVFAELKKDAALTNIAAGAVGGEETLKTIPLVLGLGWLPFINKITSIKLTGAADSIVAWLKPLA